MNFRLLPIPVLLLLTLCVQAKAPADSAEIYQKIYDHFRDSVNKALTYNTGKIKPEGGKVQLDVPEGFKYLNKDQSKYVLTKLWGNPETAAEDVIGMIFPKDSDPFADSSYAFVVTYSEIGYVKDEDADKINYEEMMKNMQEGEKAENEKRVKEGYPAIHLVGWAEKPYYDEKRKILHWAKELKFGEEDGPNTLNYEIRILGRKGMVSLNAVGKMYDLSLVNRDISKVLSVASFTDGNSYFDFNPKVDNVAAWTIGGLVAGKLLAKAGLFALAAKFLAPFWKFIVLAFVGIGAWFKKKLGLKKEAAAQQTYHSGQPEIASSTDLEHPDHTPAEHTEETAHTEEVKHAGEITHTDADVPPPISGQTEPK